MCQVSDLPISAQALKVVPKLALKPGQERLKISDGWIISFMGKKKAPSPPACVNAITELLDNMAKKNGTRPLDCSRYWSFIYE